MQHLLQSTKLADVLVRLVSEYVDLYEILRRTLRRKGNKRVSEARLLEISALLAQCPKNRPIRSVVLKSSANLPTWFLEKHLNEWEVGELARRRDLPDDFIRDHTNLFEPIAVQHWGLRARMAYQRAFCKNDEQKKLFVDSVYQYKTFYKTWARRSRWK